MGQKGKGGGRQISSSVYLGPEEWGEDVDRTRRAPAVKKEGLDALDTEGVR